MTPPFGLMMFWLPEMRMRPLWMSAMRRPRIPQTMLVVLVRVAVTVTTLNYVVINLNSVMINVILNCTAGGHCSARCSSCGCQTKTKRAPKQLSMTAFLKPN